MNQRMKRKITTIENTFSIFIIVIVVTLSVTFFITMYLSTQNLGKSLYQDLIETKTSDIKNLIEHHINDDVTTITTYADFPIITNSVMHPKDTYAYFEDFMSELLILGKKAHYKLLDINGEITKNFNSSHLQKSKKPHWVDKIIEAVIPYHAELFLKSNTVYIRYAVPVKYQNSPEGILVAEKKFNLEKILQDITQKQNLFIEISDANQVFTHFGNKNTNGHISSKVTLDEIQALLHLQTEPQKLKTSLKNLIYIILFISVLMGIFFLLLFRRIGTKLFVEPQKLLDTANQRLLRANEELEQFAYHSSHELKAPLTTIKGLASYVKKDLPKGNYEEAQKNISKIINQSSKLERIVTDILQLAISDVENMIIEEIDLNSLVIDLKESLALQISKKNVKISCEWKLNQPFYGNKIRMTQVLENLISNSIKYCDDKKEKKFVHIRGFDKNPHIHIVVEDNGLGFPQESQGKVFKLFKRFHPKVANGSGFGLSIVKKHIDRLKGHIHFKSSNEGTTFELILPQEQKPQKRRSA